MESHTEMRLTYSEIVDTLLNFETIFLENILRDSNAITEYKVQ